MEWLSKVGRSLRGLWLKLVELIFGRSKQRPSPLKEMKVWPM